MRFTRQLVDGLAALLQEAGLGTYRPSGPAYGAGDTAIVAGVMPEAPDRVLLLTPYSVEDTDLPDGITGMQVRMRAGRDPRDVGDLADDVRDLLHNRRHYQLGGVHVALSWRESQAPLGQDRHGRHELTSNYYLRASSGGPNLYE
ncbi:MAG: minor capsid protein [Pseudonocardia sp.]